jgi:hypothetical protein
VVSDAIPLCISKQDFDLNDSIDDIIFFIILFFPLILTNKFLYIDIEVHWAK